jgi:NADH dehydrogenase/NADH:ubiquinone oxidoreductase subunit G
MDAIVLVGFNPKMESPVLNARILRGVNHRGLKVYKIGSADDLNYDYTHLGNDI